ncbi:MULTISPECIES: ABC transporter substrate-binding protein [unclassified Fusibacter]|uniref:ABC transporter substrate-binding protein n=1 Tax=unclassified Fusibacter TaxID=2624464 RepID=UPI00101180A3|nr:MULTISPECIES: ABC transporter substrate-binding protein [unclassified Fusibacter]MCK8058332.1 ABC transporter substrate-binding protein [Fusibacter sp. A2]NPE20915.1 ABC transporter substrate-binding protein [Fusibacter sp. A1]RXV63118.1 ABC transporter substrate-binding protein [Fusibacter sp. A1]
MSRLKWYGIGLVIGIVIVLFTSVLQIKTNLIADLMHWWEFNQHKETALIIGRANDAIGLDPAVVTDQESLKVTINLYDTLVVYDRSGASVEPSLAESWSVSDNGLVWHFKIRQGVVFHDNTPLDAQAVIFNFNRWMDPSNPYHAGHFSYWNLSFGGFPGIVDHVRAISDDVVEIKLSEPYAPFLNTLAMPAFGIASPEAIKTYNEALKYKPVGTGPFIFESWNENGEIKLTKNSLYWGAKPKVDALIFKSIISHRERYVKLKGSEIHIAYDLPAQISNELEEEDELTLSRRPVFNVGYLAFNMSNKHLKLANVREAIGHMIDKDAMIEAAFDATTRPASTFVPPVLWGHHEGIESIAYDVDEAKRLLRKVGIRETIELNLLLMDSPREYFPNPVSLGLFLKDSFAKAGIDLHLEILPWEEVIAKSKNGDYDMVLAGWNGDVADPDNFLYNFFASENTSKGLITNYSLYHNQEVDNLLSQARQMNDQSFRESLYREIQELIALEIPAIPLIHTMPTIGLSKTVKGFVPHISGVEPLNLVELKEVAK